MKRTFKSILAAAGLAFIGLGSLLTATPANATVQTCTRYVPPQGFPNPGYPVSNGHLYFCFPNPRSVPETQMQLLARNTVVSALSNWTTAVRNQLSAKNIDFYVFYTGFDALQTLGFASPEPPIKPTETGRSWVLPLQTLQLPNPTTAIFLFNVDQFNALNGRIPTSGDLVQAQLSGTTRHESSHQMDRVWAQILNYAPTASATIVKNTTNTNYGTAVNWDGARLTPQDISDLKTKYPRLLIDPTVATPVLNNNEIFAESIAAFIGGGARVDEDNFIKAKFPCAFAYARDLYSSNTVPAPVGIPKPATVPSTACYGNTQW